MGWAEERKITKEKKREAERAAAVRVAKLRINEASNLYYKDPNDARSMIYLTTLVNAYQNELLLHVLSDFKDGGPVCRTETGINGEVYVVAFLTGEALAEYDVEKGMSAACKVSSVFNLVLSGAADGILLEPVRGRENNICLKKEHILWIENFAISGKPSTVAPTLKSVTIIADNKEMAEEEIGDEVEELDEYVDEDALDEATLNAKKEFEDVILKFCKNPNEENNKNLYFAFLAAYLADIPVCIPVENIGDYYQYKAQSDGNKGVYLSAFTTREALLDYTHEKHSRVVSLRHLYDILTEGNAAGFLINPIETSKTFACFGKEQWEWVIDMAKKLEKTETTENVDKTENIESTEEVKKNENVMEQPIFCRKCGTKLPSDSLFCTRCGTQIIKMEDID